jgi:DNA (cytosine-5)-methyltransferase 1
MNLLPVYSAEAQRYSRACITPLHLRQPINKAGQVRLIDSSVCPDEAEALVAANAADLIELYRRLAA